MPDPEKRQKKIIKDLPDIMAARQREVTRDFRYLLGQFNLDMINLGVCDGNKCKYHKIKPGMHNETCFCQRALMEPTRASFWNTSHWENCSQGLAGRMNKGCPGFVMDGAPLYQEAVMGRKVI